MKALLKEIEEEAYQMAMADALRSAAAKRTDFSTARLVEGARADRDRWRGDTRTVWEVSQGMLTPDKSFPFPKQNVAEQLHAIITENGLEACNMSDQLSPQMTIAQLYEFKLRLLTGCHNQPQTVFYVTCDTVTPVEALLFLDDELKLLALSCNVRYHGHAQALVWRGEDYVRIGALDECPAGSLRQAMVTLLDKKVECCVCMKELNEVENAADANVLGTSAFVCQHVLCLECSQDERNSEACPICRSTVKFGDGARPKNKKKARADRRRGRGGR